MVIYNYLSHNLQVIVACVFMCVIISAFSLACIAHLLPNPSLKKVYYINTNVKLVIMLAILRTKLYRHTNELTSPSSSCKNTENEILFTI